MQCSLIIPLSLPQKVVDFVRTIRNGLNICQFNFDYLYICRIFSCCVERAWIVTVFRVLLGMEGRSCPIPRTTCTPTFGARAMKNLSRNDRVVHWIYCIGRRCWMLCR